MRKYYAIKYLMKSTLSEKDGHSVAMKKGINDSSIKEKMFLISLLEISKMTNILLFIPTLYYNRTLYDEILF